MHRRLALTTFPNGSLLFIVFFRFHFSTFIDFSLIWFWFMLDLLKNLVEHWNVRRCFRSVLNIVRCVCVVVNLWSCIQTYVDCRCVGATALNSSLPEMTSRNDVTARQGRCLPECSLVIVYAIVIFLATITFSLCMAPDTVVNFRSVHMFCCFTFVFDLYFRFRRELVTCR